jgi:siroheme synthase-like protein
MPGKVWYPIFLDIEGRRAVVIGGGVVALRKTRGLIEAGAQVTVISPHFDPGFDELPIQRIQREFEDGDIEGAALVFAATNVREVNRRAGELARSRGIPANIADAPQECGFIVPARILRDGVQIAISTGGEAPARAALLRKKLEEWLKLMRP